MEPVIQVEHLKKHYGKVAAVHDLSFSIRAGEIVGLLGPNGAGKSTTIHMLLGLLTPTAGNIHIFGLSMPGKRREILQRSNFAAAYATLPYNLTTEETLMIFAGLYGKRNPKRAVDPLIERFNIGPFRKRKLGKLSSGENARVTLAKAFINDPELLFLDEPTASLDPDFADQIRSEILDMHREHNMTILWTSHNMHEVEEVCERVLFLRHGRLVADAPPAELIRDGKADDLEDVFIALSRKTS